ncbi:MAG: DNA (cytosine-5)-methyltransferase 1, partial [Granulosicoccus sp.]
MPIKVVELFAGVGGFRVGLEGYPKDPKSAYEVVWSNQFEPSTKVQHASKVYETHWPDSNHRNRDISDVPSADIPYHDLLVGGFPCQDYSVASTLKNSGGLIGKKGVLWWQIFRILEDKGKKAPDHLFLENVDRLLISPAIQRGRDFAVMLSSLNQLGYAVEWRVINAADFGMPQRRRRVFIFGYKKGTAGYKRISKLKSPSDLILETGIFAETFPVDQVKELRSESLDSDLVKLSETFNIDKKKNPFENAGFMINGSFFTMKTEANYDGPRITLKDILVPAKKVDSSFYLKEEDLPKWQYMKGAKNEERFNKAGNFHYRYAEGGM